MAFLKVKDRFVYLDRQRKHGLITAVLSEEEQRELHSEGGNPKSGLMKHFNLKARKFLTLLLDQEEKLFEEDFERIYLWDEDARRELADVMLDWCEISGRFKIWEQAWGNPLGDSFTLTDRNPPNKWMKVLFGRVLKPKVMIRLDTNDLVCISGTLDSLVLQFGGCLLTLSKDQLSCMMCPEPAVKSFRERRAFNPQSPKPQENPTNKNLPLNALTKRPRFLRTAFNYLASTFFLLFLIGFSVDSLIPMPASALLLVDANGNYYAPPCLMDKGFGSMRKINAFAEAEGYQVTWKSELREDQKPAPDCRGSGYLMQEGRSLSGEFLEMIGLLGPLPSRWNANGTWNY